VQEIRMLGVNSFKFASLAHELTAA